ncbi:MAG: 50S ribosomal protein L36 [Alphaproteobacteria bacterium]|nr:50S ribosomal protein L36 [Alphaproteobacteria bacterium]MBL0717897.1 50S ribosomal protein L36 [Alphaproteobacteria bacterium]
MKIFSSLKSKKLRGNVKLVRRGKRVFLIDKENPRFKACQGKK